MAMVEQDRAAWLEERKTGIGASEAAAALGVNPYKSPMELWAEKCGLTEPPDLSENEAVEFGVRLERPILDAYAARSGRSVNPHDQTKREVHLTYPFIFCTPDAWQSKQPNDTVFDGLAQIKAVGAFAASDWKDGPPLQYQVQCQQELLVTGCQWGTLVVLIGGQKLRYFDFEANPKFQKALVDRLTAFWEAVETRTPPGVDASLSTARILEKLHPLDSGASMALSEEAAEWDADIAGAKEKIKTLEELIRDRENRLKSAIGDATYGVLPNGGRWSWKTQTRKAYQVEENTFRVLRRLAK